MSLQHTPGPWEARAENHGGYGARWSVGRAQVGPEHTLARVLSINGKTGTNEANACLMAAAPELYDALDEAFAFLGGVDGAVEIRTRILAALIKATPKATP